jgi:hypothetical protein
MKENQSQSDHQKIQYEPKRSKKIYSVIGLIGIFLLSSCTAPQISPSVPISTPTNPNLSSPYYPEKNNPPLKPDFSHTTQSGITFDFYIQDGIKRTFSEEQMKKYIDPLCPTSTNIDTKIPVYFTTEDNCSRIKDGYGCTWTEPGSNEKYINILAQKTKQLFQSQAFGQIQLCDNGIIINPKNDNTNHCPNENFVEIHTESSAINMFEAHEYKHACGQGDSAAYPAGKNYVEKINQQIAHEDLQYQMIEEIR